VFHCPKCNKNVVLMAISQGGINEEELNQLVESFKKDGNLVVLNPPPHPPYKCPVCSTELTRLENDTNFF